MVYKVLDTNIPLLSADNILTLGQGDVTIVLPETVLAELDAKKSGFEEINFQARACARLLSTAEIESTVTEEDGTTTVMNIGDDVRIMVVSLNVYEASSTEYGGNDQRIVQVAKTLQGQIPGDDSIVLMSNDLLMRLRALAVGVPVTDFKAVDDAEFEFVKEYRVEDPEVFRTLHNASVLEVDPDYELEHYSYKFTCSTTNQMKLATVSNGFINVLGKDGEREIRRQECPPIGSEQLLASKAILDPTIDLVIIEGKAGSGKNIVAVSSLMKLLKISKDKYDSIIYIRNPVNDIGNPDEEIGFLSTNEGKEAVYLGPMEDTLQFIARNKVLKNKQETIPEYELRVGKKVEDIRAEYGMESIISLGLRGRTFSNSLIILDEFQNAGSATTQKVLTRVGKDCKVVVLGSLNQIDSKYLTKYNNGLSILMHEASVRAVDSTINMFTINLTTTKRSDMCDFAEKLFAGS